MDIRNNFEGVLEIYNSLSIKEQLLVCHDRQYTDSKSVKVRKVLYINNEPISFIELYQLIDTKIAYVIVCTKQEYRLLGYSKKLFEIIEKENIKTQQYKKFFWAVKNNNIPSIAFCKSLGFKQINNGLYEKEYFF